jgi:hypothetical protein
VPSRTQIIRINTNTHDTAPKRAATVREWTRHLATLSAKKLARFLLISFVLAVPAAAHLGSPDIFFESAAGPYRLFVTIRPPTVIPGVAELEVRSSSKEVTAIRATPAPLIGDGAKYAPRPEPLTQSKDDPQYFTGSLWLMATGSWQVKLYADGASGTGELSIPVPALATQTKKLDPKLGVLLFVLMLLLIGGLISIVGAGAGEGQVEPGLSTGPKERRRSRVAMAFAAVLLAAMIWGGDTWWTAEANSYGGYVYKPLAMDAQVDQSTGKLRLEIKESGWARRRKTDDFVPDHSHLMHLYMIRMPEMDRAWHLHPTLEAGSTFVQQLPDLAAGRYRLYGDIVHRDGLPETMVADLDLSSALEGRPLEGDDATGPDPGKYRVTWISEGPIEARKPGELRFKLVDEQGLAADDIELYMGMLGHAAIIKKDGTVFAHIHPSGSVPMAALAIAENKTGDSHAGHPGMEMDDEAKLPSEVAFPYGFPTPGAYKIVVQMKADGKIYTGIFDAGVH